MVDQRKFGRYEILGELGHGGMATVYHATDPSFGREVAIKVLPLQLQHNPQFRERFQREGRTIAGLEHPNIVPVYDVGEEDSVPFLVMRYMQGGTLSERIPEGGMSLDKAAHIISRLAAALDAAHSKNIVHRDLKPSNVLFDQYGEAYVADFGIVKLSEDTMQLTGSGVIGTPTYMSPEQASGSVKVDSRSDIYSLAVVLYQMLTGRLPFEAETPMAIAVKHITEAIPDILAVKDGLPEAMRPIMQQALAKDPEKRYQKAGDFAADLRALASGEPPTGVMHAHHDEGHTMPMTMPAIPLATGTRPSVSEPAKTIIETSTRPAPARSGIDPMMVPIIAISGVVVLTALILIFRPFRALNRAMNNNTPTQSAVIDETEAPTENPTDLPPPTATVEPTIAPTEEPSPLLVEREVAEADSVTVDLAMAAVTTTVIAADEGVTVLEADFIDETGEVDVPTVRFNTQGSVETVSVDQRIPDLFVADEDPLGEFEVRLPREVPIDLRVRSGFGDAVIDLRGLNIRSLTVYEGYATTIFLPEAGDIAIRVEQNYGEIRFEAPEDASGLLIRSFELVESFGLVRIELPAAGDYTVSVSTYNEVQFLVPSTVDVFMDAPAEQVVVESQNDRFSEGTGGSWSTGGSDNPLVNIVVISNFGTIRLLPSQ